jgi:hypothetical protein
LTVGPDAIQNGGHIFQFLVQCLSFIVILRTRVDWCSAAIGTKAQKRVKRGGGGGGGTGCYKPGRQAR